MPPNPDVERYFIAGDQPIPPELQGGSGTHRATPTAHALVYYRSRWQNDAFEMEVDVYALPGEPIRLHLLCPKCQHALTLDQTKKAIDWTPPPPGGGKHGTISVETFQCTWEMGDKTELGQPLCGWRVAIDRNVARDA